MESDRKISLIYASCLVIALGYVFIGTVAAHPFDDAIYAYNAQIFYFLHGSPFIYLPQGIFFDIINVAGYFPVALSSIFTGTNVLFIEIGVKIPFILFTFLSSLILYKIGNHLKFNGIYASLLLLTSPIYFFTSVVYGSAIVVSMFFLISGLYLALKEKAVLSAIMYGIASGTYLYPIFAIPVLARYIYVKKGRRDAAIYLLVSLIFASVGQLVILFFFLKNGIIAASPNNPSAYLSPYSTVPYYNIFDFLYILGKGDVLPGQTYNILYYGSSIFFSLSYLLVNRKNVNERSLIVFLLIQGALFASLAPYNLPSYMTALIPLAIIVGLYLRRWSYIVLMWISTVFSFVVMQTINPVGFIVYFSDVNINVLNIKSAYPPWINSIAGSLYALSLLMFIPLSLRGREGAMKKIKRALAPQSAAVAAIVVVGMLIFIPVSSSVPQGMYLSPTIDSFQAAPTSMYLVGTTIVSYYNFPILGTMDRGGLSHFIGEIEYPTSYYPIYNTTGIYEKMAEQFSQYVNIVLPIRNPSIEFSGVGRGSATVELHNSSSTINFHGISNPTGNRTEFMFYANTTISGHYLMIVNSSISLLFHNGTFLGMSMGGIPSYGSAFIDGRELMNSTIYPSNLGGSIRVVFDGPFLGIPKIMPVLVVHQLKPLGRPGMLELLIGGILFVAVIVLTPLLLFFSVHRKRVKHPL